MEKVAPVDHMISILPPFFIHPCLFVSTAYLLILFKKLVGKLCEYLQEGKVRRSTRRVIWVLLGGHSYLDTLPRSNIRIGYVSQRYPLILCLYRHGDNFQNQILNRNDMQMNAYRTSKKFDKYLFFKMDIKKDLRSTVVNLIVNDPFKA